MRISIQDGGCIDNVCMEVRDAICDELVASEKSCIRCAVDTVRAHVAQAHDEESGLGSHML